MWTIPTILVKPITSDPRIPMFHESDSKISWKRLFFMGVGFYFLFLLLTPLGLFNDWIPPLSHSGYYSVKTVDGGDDTGYYAYLRSVFFDGDLDFIDEHYYAHTNRFNSTGYVFSNWQLGQAVLYLPFFMVGHLSVLLYSALGYPVKADGYSAPYFIATAVASTTYLFAGLMIMIQILKKIVGERIAWVTSISLWMASPLLYYTFIRQRMAHTTEFFLAALFVLVWIYYRESTRKSHHAVMGVCLGLLCLVRLINANYGVLYIADMAFLWFAGRNSSNRIPVKDVLINVLCFTGMFLVMLLPQFVAWNQLNGFIISPYLVDTFQGQATEISTSFIILGSKLYDIFFSAKWGLMVATPLWFAGLIGLLIPGPVPKSIRFASVVSVISLIIVMLSFVESDAYGNRYLIAAAVLLTMGLANLLHRFFDNKATRHVAMVFVLICVAIQYLMIVQYKVTLPYNHPRFSFEALSGITQILFDQPTLLLRSTNFFRLIGFEKGTWDFVDGMYLLIFPLAQLVCVVGVSCLLGRSTYETSAWEVLTRPKNVIAVGILMSLILVGIVNIATPDKPLGEIEKRVTYKKLLSEGDSFLAKENWDSAQTSFEKASFLMPSLWTPYFKQGIAFGAQNKFKQAAKHYKAGLEIYPDDPSLLVNYGTTLSVLEKFNEAAPILRASIRQWPRNPNAYNALAMIYLKQNNHEKAKDMFFLAVAVKPNFGTGHANLAILYDMMNDKDQATAHLERALELGVRGPIIDNLLRTLQIPPLKS